jgi:type IV secretory pathway VirB9-like protein
MRTPLLLAALCLPSAAMAQGAGCSEPAQMHGRLAVVPYKLHTLYECIISPDVATTIIAAGNEMVGPAAAADPEGLDVRKTVNMVIVQPKPAEINRHPNMTFETKNERDGAVRTYIFLFHVAGYGGVPAIELIYPEDEAKAKRETAADQPPRESAQVASTLRTAPFYSPARKEGMNWQYSCMCDAGRPLTPSISDNGQNTIVSYKGSTPADIVVARLDRDGTEKKPSDTPHRETVVNFTPLSTGGPLIIPEVAEYWRIRSGNEVIDIRNDFYHPELIDVRSGTPSPYVVRTVRPTPLPKPPAQPQHPVTTASQ